MRSILQPLTAILATLILALVAFPSRGLAQCYFDQYGNRFCPTDSGWVQVQPAEFEAASNDEIVGYGSQGSYGSSGSTGYRMASNQGGSYGSYGSSGGGSYGSTAYTSSRCPECGRLRRVGRVRGPMRAVIVGAARMPATVVRGAVQFRRASVVRRTARRAAWASARHARVSNAWERMRRRHRLGCG